MDLVPRRRGILHYGALALALFVTLCGLGFSVWGCSLAAELWQIRHLRPPHPSTAEVRADPRYYREILKASRPPQMHGLKTTVHFCEGALRALGIVTTLLLIAALTTPGRPRFLRFADWQNIPDLRRAAWLDFGLTAASLLLFTAVYFVAEALVPDLSRSPVLPADGEEVSRLLATGAARMTQAARTVLPVAGVAVLLFATIFFRLSRRLWQGFRAERQRRRAEDNALTVGKF